MVGYSSILLEANCQILFVKFVKTKSSICAVPQHKRLSLNQVEGNIVTLGLIPLHLSSISDSIYRYHRHPQPPNGKPHPYQLEQFANVVLNNPKARPHELRTGSALPSASGLPGPGQSVALIAPQFNNLGHIGYRRRQVLAQNRDVISSYTGTDRFISDYMQFRQQCPEFVQHFQLDDDVQILSVQAPFIRELFSQELFNQSESDSGTSTGETLPSIFRNGMISDGAHKFFFGATLNHTCAYFEVLHRWQPILASWMGRQNVETYTIHFLTLFNTISSQLYLADPDIRLSSFHQIIGTVVDFSDAQRSGFERAYVKFMTETDYGHRFQM